MTRLMDLLNYNRLIYHDHFFTQVIIAELLLTIDQKHSELSSSNENVTKILNVIDSNYRDTLTLNDIAKKVNINVSYMQKIFKAAMGNTVYDYLNQYRINQAISLMKSTTLPLLDIAIEVGFSNRQTFYNVFKTYMGYPPKTFRKFLTSYSQINHPFK